MADAGADAPPSSDPSVAHHSAGSALTVPTEPPEPGDWASLPPDLLRLCLTKCAALVQGGSSLPLQEAAQLLASLSPCRAWREVALAEASAAIEQSWL